MSGVARFVEDNVMLFKWQHSPATVCDPELWIGHPFRRDARSVNDSLTVTVQRGEIAVYSKASQLWRKTGDYTPLCDLIHTLVESVKQAAISREEESVLKQLDHATRGLYKPNGGE